MLHGLTCGNCPQGSIKEMLTVKVKDLVKYLMHPNLRGIVLLWNCLDAPGKKEKEKKEQNVLRGKAAMLPHVAILILLTAGSTAKQIHVIICSERPSTTSASLLHPHLKWINS